MHWAYAWNDPAAVDGVVVVGAAVFEPEPQAASKSEAPMAKAISIFTAMTPPLRPKKRL
jgi:hypothetical protein